MIQYDYRRRLSYIPGGAIQVAPGAWPAAGSGIGTTGLVAWWSMDETSGTRADSHGSNDLSDVNTVGYATGKVSNAADFIPANVEYLEIASNSDVQLGGTDFTIALWYYADAISSTGNWLISKRDASTNNEYQITLFASTSSVRFAVFHNLTNTASTIGNSTNTPYATGSWQFLVCRFNNTSKLQEIIINAGTPFTTTATGITIANGGNELAIGAASWGVARAPTTSHDGLLDEVSIWKRVLTNDEVSWLYNSGNGRAYSEL